ncbi:copper resistance protein CopD [Flavobacterium plurextorum]|uniref:Copper resistance protein CopD n=1 Tax=Flavobacterium plurextorum TaxID=1114867 RepID=A0ABX4CZB7_9FLAO|nr:CopD family protein [Flavobacterium plurextorum]OXB11294.1 copper resistance protein CopD [Flavobacterium plurextorum]
MKLHHFLLIIHLISATIWVGGHLVLSIRYLPSALKQKDPSIILNYEKKFEALGMSSLLLLIITGIMMAYDFGVSFDSWFSFSSGIEKVVSVKLLLLLFTFLLALIAQFSVIPNLSKHNINKMAVLIISVSLIGVTMLILGSSVRYGGI